MSDNPELTSLVKGRIGELLAAAAIEQCGWKTLLTPMEDIDLVAMHGTRFMRVQVKASSLIYAADRQPTYNFKTAKRGIKLRCDLIDIVALVAVDIRKVIFTTPDALQKTTRVAPYKYTQIDIESITWDNAVAQILGESDVICSGPEVA